MATIIEAPTLGSGTPAASAARARRWMGWHTGLVLLAVGAALLTTWSVWSGSRSDYYASIALSMSRSWSNFLFGALDPAGTVTLDKIPGSYWIPALFVKAFGFSSWTVVLPNALAAVAAALLVAFTAKRLLNPAAGLLAGAVVATTPILVAVARSNQPETFFVLGLAAVGWAAAKAMTRRSFGWLVVAGLFVALSFQTYMLEAWAVWPALAAAWLCTRTPWLRKIWQLAVAGLISLVGSLAWIIAVSLVPASSRPYIGSTLGNSAWEMVFGYNGLGRFGDTTADSVAYRSFTPPFSGDPGVLRLFNEQLAGQVAWLLPTAFLAIAVLWVLRFSRPVTVLLGVWLATFAVMFSVVAGMHQFYTAALAIPMALAIGLAFAVARRHRSTWAQVSLLGVAAVTALAIGFWYGGYSIFVAVAQAVLAAIAILAIVRERMLRLRPRAVVAALAGAALLLTPLAWSVVAIANPSATNPVAGGVADMAGFGFGGAPGGLAGQGRSGPPGGQGQFGRGAAPQGGGLGAAQGPQANQPPAGGAGLGQGQPGGGVDTELIAYLQTHQDGADYLAATFGAQSAAGLIIASDGGSFLPIGGFNGGDPVPTLDRFEQLVADGSLRFVIATGGGGFGGIGQSGTSAQILQWVQQNCSQPSDAPTTSLYECTATASAGT
ncbi:ArnT family glycosyltransferase [Microbacterium deminutum]|uniref:4-amino-4-deoxy-L-arabinose transferase n=1 Tax=Microbacterium deminutum TaxID=344164 RepID=A0ABN2R758_9MICO